MNNIGIKALNVFLIIISIPFFLWGAVCFLGGPDGKIGSLESIMFGLGFSAVGVVLLFVKYLLKRKFSSIKEETKEDAEEKFPVFMGLLVFIVLGGMFVTTFMIVVN